MTTSSGVSGQHCNSFKEKVEKTFVKTKTNAISITSGTFHLTLNQKPDFLLTKLQRRLLTHNYVV